VTRLRRPTAGGWPRDGFPCSDDPRGPGLGEAVVTALRAWSRRDDERE